MSWSGNWNWWWNLRVLNFRIRAFSLALALIGFAPNLLYRVPIIWKSGGPAAPTHFMRNHTLYNNNPVSGTSYVTWDFLASSTARGAVRVSYLIRWYPCPVLVNFVTETSVANGIPGSLTDFTAYVSWTPGTFPEPHGILLNKIKYYFRWFLFILLGSLFREDSGSDCSGLHGLNMNICSRCSLSLLVNVTWFVIHRIIDGSLRKSNHNWRYTNPNGTFEQTPRVYSSVYLWLCSFDSILDNQMIENGKIQAKGWFRRSWCTQ